MAEESAAVVTEETAATATIEETAEVSDAEVEAALAEFDSVKGEVTENPDPLAPAAEETGTEEVTEETTEVEETGETAETAEVAPVNITPEEDTSGVYETAIEDPGEFTPGDHSFTITLNDGKTYKVTSSEDADAVAELLDENPDLATAKTLIGFNRQLAKMEANIERDRAVYDEQKTAYEAAQSQTAARDTMITNLNNGMNYLESKGLLPELPAALNTADVKWEDHPDDPAVKARLDLLAYMSTENDNRIAAGLEPNFDIIAAYNAKRLEDLQKEEVTTSKRDKQTRQAKGAMVSGRSPSVVSNQKPGEIVGVGGSLNDLSYEDILG